MDHVRGRDAVEYRWRMQTSLWGAASALLVGLLLGLERERAHRGEPELFAGIRTFPMLSLGGYLAATTGHALALVSFVLGVAGLAVVSYARKMERPAGATTEVVALSAPLLGALVHGGHATLAASSAVVMTLLLTLKDPLHRLAGNVSEEEILSILKFGIVAVIVLPLLPTKPLGPYGALVPRHVGWVILVLTGVSLGGYLLVRLLGNRYGWALAGLLGGLVSSTAVTLSFASKARTAPEIARALAVGTILASTVLYLRGFLLIAVFDLDLALALGPHLAGLFALGLAVAFVTHRREPAEKASGLVLGNPVELGRALALGLLFAAILVMARAAREELGTGGLRAAGILGGLMDVDSVAVVVAGLHRQGLADLDAAQHSYLLATLANLAVKAGLVAIIGKAPLARKVLLPFAALAVLTVALIFH